MTKWCVEQFSKSEGWVPLTEVQMDEVGDDDKIHLRHVSCRDLPSREEANRINAYLCQHILEPDNLETHTRVNVEFGSGCWDYKGAGSNQKGSSLHHRAVISLDDLVNIDRKYKGHGMTISGPFLWRHGGMGGDCILAIIDHDTGDEDQTDPYYPNKRWRREP